MDKKEAKGTPPPEPIEVKGEYEIYETPDGSNSPTITTVPYYVSKNKPPPPVITPPRINKRAPPPIITPKQKKTHKRPPPIITPPRINRRAPAPIKKKILLSLLLETWNGYYQLI